LLSRGKKIQPVPAKAKISRRVSAGREAGMTAGSRGVSGPTPILQKPGRKKEIFPIISKKKGFKGVHKKWDFVQV
jgi:hypothetical protein